ncbi:MAG: PAS domain-containing protein, partial [Candidatus Izemoplasmatales bacterium]|nr:PAS domain-containing protein [Candidatus Izemoplasmatales bacterium]
EDIINSFKSGEKDHEDFWIKMKNMYVLIRYYAIRDKNGQYIGTLEVTEDIKPIQEITGEKRLVENK